MSQSSSTTFFFSVFLTFHLLAKAPISIAESGLPDPRPDPVQTQTFFPTTATSTISAFPEQSDAGTCPLDLPEDLFRGIRSACGSGRLQRIRCCPVLEAWLYSAYSTTALRRAKAKAPTAFDMPVLPDDSETCVRSLENGLVARGIELAKPNQSCDVLYCYCGIRLHHFTCPEAFSLNSRGELVGDERVKRLERDCLSGGSARGHSGAAGCSNCLNSLYMVSSTTTTATKYGASNRSDEERGNKMRARDCRVMGLTWLLNKNQSAYIPTVTSVLRALMVSADPLSCTLDHDGMPLAVDSSELGDQSSSTALHFPTGFALFFLTFVFYSTGSM
ncbi:hypothetical protein DM860_010281 [Cuscuta australis]|uniref:SPARK domain-containing protein n=1 Tax=Cuscuta australis TaxID=267555 RepID=A0A328D6Q8_9ASTE|nr:hypothetical protein DM860_010281 [Cuscuta australis]